MGYWKAITHDGGEPYIQICEHTNIPTNGLSAHHQTNFTPKPRGGFATVT